MGGQKSKGKRKCRQYSLFLLYIKMFQTLLEPFQSSFISLRAAYKTVVFSIFMTFKNLDALVFYKTKNKHTQYSLFIYYILLRLA